MDTYPLIVLIKLDFPAPESPVIAMSTFTSCHPSILLLNNFAMKPRFRRPFFSTSFWKSCRHFDFQFIAKGRLEAGEIHKRDKRKWPSTATRLYYVEAGTRDETFSIPVHVREFIAVIPRGGPENGSHQSQGLLGGAKTNCTVLTPYLCL